VSNLNKIGFIGMGNMGRAMSKGIINEFGKDNVLFKEASLEMMEQFSRETGIMYKENVADLAKESKYIILAVKPQVYQAVLEELKQFVDQKHIIISIAPGISINDVKNILGTSIRVVRAMPNTPAMVAEGMSALCFSNDEYSNVDKDTIERIFNSFGKSVILDEKLMNAVVGISGSSPAYVYIFIEALADAAVKYGIPRDLAYTLAAQSVLGSAKMVLETKEHPGKLKDQVCSPGGTTIAAVATLEETGFRSSIIKAVDSCYDKCVSVGERK
jgi:pyrroline-5-carboxylate reductase